jgi:hypothetical protein
VWNRGRAGDLDAAAALANQLPHSLTKIVLSNLIAVRAPTSPYRGTDGGWIGALETAWRDAGSPDLSESELLNFDSRAAGSLRDRGRDGLRDVARRCDRDR